MSYSTFSFFLLFLAPVFLMYTVCPKRCKWIVLLASGYVFFWINSNTLIAFLLVSTLSVYGAGLWMNRIQDSFDVVKKTLEKPERKLFKARVQRQKRTVAAAALTVNFGILIFLKYFNFLGGSLISLINLFGANIQFTSLKFVLPLGISFYTLSAASYVIDVCRGKYAADKNLGRVALFLSFFPQIVEGPISRYDELAHQLYEGHSFDYKRFTFGLQLIFWGLFKKIVIADRINGYVMRVFKDNGKYGGYVVAAAMLLYTLQLYAEFSGCMDIVTGCAQLFGVKLSKNFERPFFSGSVNEFWRRWHITLGAWLRDYVFYSVSLSKPFAKLSKWARKRLGGFWANLVPAAFALLFVWLGNGFWHGSGLKYICYGMYYYLLMLLGMMLEPVFKKICESLRINRASNGFRVFAVARTFLIVNIGMLMFRADTLTDWWNMLVSIFSKPAFVAANGNLWKLGLDRHDMLVIVLGVVVMLIVSVLQERKHSIRQEISKKNIVLRWSIYFALVLSVIVLGAYGNGYGAVAFIYGQF